MKPEILHQFRSRSPIFDWYLFSFGFWCSFFSRNHVKIGFLVSENIKITHVFILSSEKDMHKRKFSISMAAILNFFNLNLLNVQKKLAP